MKVRISRADAIRAALSAACTIPLGVPLAARADLNQGALGATCVGFGCNDYRGQDFNGMPAPGGEDYVSENTLQVVRPAERGSMPYSEFLQALKDKRVLGVDFIAPNGDEAYAIVKDSGGTKSCSAINPDAPVVDGVCRLRMGEGWPVEVSNSWSSPSWVVRILDNEQVPHALVIDLKKKPQRAVYPKAGGVAKL